MNLENSEHTRFPPVMVDDPRIARAIRFLERTPAYSMQLTDVANHMDLSPFHLQRIFKSTMGETPAAYLRRTRLDRAAMNLQMSSEPITAIALNAGYQSHEAFIRAFHHSVWDHPLGLPFGRAVAVVACVTRTFSRYRRRRDR